MEEMIKEICKFEDTLTNMLACIIVGDMFMGNTITKQNNKTMRTTINKEDYSITICFDKNGEAYWNLSCKGQSKFATKEELLMVSGTLGLLKKRIDFKLIKDTYKE